MSSKQEIAAAMVRKPTVRELEKQILASLPLSVRSVLVERWSEKTIPGYGFDGDVCGYLVNGDCPPEDIAEAIQVTNRSLAPCEETTILAELGRLRLATKSRAEGEENLLLIMQIYADLLAEYPQDAVIEATRYWARNEIFWPALAELKTELDRRTVRRRLLLTALLSKQAEQMGALPNRR